MKREKRAEKTNKIYCRVPLFVSSVFVLAFSAIVAITNTVDRVTARSARNSKCMRACAPVLATQNRMYVVHG